MTAKMRALAKEGENSLGPAGEAVCLQSCPPQPQYPAPPPTQPSSSSHPSPDLVGDALLSRPPRPSLIAEVHRLDDLTRYPLWLSPTQTASNCPDDVAQSLTMIADADEIHCAPRSVSPDISVDDSEKFHSRSSADVQSL